MAIDNSGDVNGLTPETRGLRTKLVTIICRLNDQRVDKGEPGLKVDTNELTRLFHSYHVEVEKKSSGKDEVPLNEFTAMLNALDLTQAEKAAVLETIGNEYRLRPIVDMSSRREPTVVETNGTERPAKNRVHAGGIQPIAEPSKTVTVVKKPWYRSPKVAAPVVVAMLLLVGLLLLIRNREKSQIVSIPAPQVPTLPPVQTPPPATPQRPAEPETTDQEQSRNIARLSTDQAILSERLEGVKHLHYDAVAGLNTRVTTLESTVKSQGERLDQHLKPARPRAQARARGSARTTEKILPANTNPRRLRYPITEKFEAPRPNRMPRLP